MARRTTRPHARAGRAHDEAMPTRRLVTIETARATAVAALIGCATALVLDALGMLVAGAVAGPLLGDAEGAPDRLGRGIVASAAVGIIVLGLLVGFLSTAARFALAELYAGLDSKDGRLRSTLLVRGQVPRAPFGPATAAFAVLGGLALLAAIPCVVLAAEHAGRLDDEPHRAEFTSWMIWAAVFITAVLLSAAAVWQLGRADRRWADGPGSRLPTGTVGHRGPAVRITSRAQRRVVRRGWTALDWAGWGGGALVAIGALAVFLGVFLHQPGLHAEPVGYSADVERLIAALTVVGGVLLIVGLGLALTTGIVSTMRTVRSVRRSTADPASVTTDDRRLVRAATTSLSDAVTAAQAMWAVVAVVAGGWWFAVHVETPADGDSSIVPELDAGLGGALLVIVWLLVGIALVGARAVLQARGPALRNRFGYTVPSEADDRDFPDLPLLGQ